MKYFVTVVETRSIVHEVVVEADSLDAAMDEAEVEAGTLEVTWDDTELQEMAVVHVTDTDGKVLFDEDAPKA